MTNWWWVRHGPTHEKAFLGWRDVAADLSDKPAIARLDAYLPRDAVLVSSDLVRSTATADAIGKGRLRLKNTRALREFNFGDWDGLGFGEVAKRNPKQSRQFWETPGDIAAPNGESWRDVSARVAEFVGRANRDYAGRNIIAVAHIGVIMTQIAVAGGLNPSEAIAHKIDPLSVTKLIWDRDLGQIGRINHNL